MAKRRPPLPTAVSSHPKIRVRMYHVGFGDCFLVSLPAVGAGMRHVLFDCGVHNAGDRAVTPAVVENILQETNRSIDVVVATHAHQDHISGFGKCAELFRQCAIREVWLPWTENPADVEAERLRRKQLALAKQLEAHLAADANAAPQAKAAVANIVGNEVALRFLKSGCGGKATVRFLEAGETLEDAAGVLGLTARVLGPPRDQTFLARMEPPKKERFFKAKDSEDGYEGVPMISDEYEISRAAGRGQFRLETGNGKKIELMNAKVEDALKASIESADTLTFYLDQAINNTSLCVKLDYFGCRMLFPGDAQYGNWQSWLDTPAAEGHLGDIDFYKVSHHGSHNGTPRTAVGHMPEGKFAAMASTQSQPWPSIPQGRLVEALHARSGGNLARSDQADGLPASFVKGEHWIDYFMEAPHLAASAPATAASSSAAAAPALPRASGGDPLARFAKVRNAGRKPGRKLPFESGEHMWLGDHAADAACLALSLPAKSLRRLKRLQGDHVFSYGEIVALSGDFYERGEELYEEKPASLPWLWEDRDLDDLKECFKKELKWIKAQTDGGKPSPYPDQNITMAWNAKNYIEMAVRNTSHFSWHNMEFYCEWHGRALEIARDCGGKMDERFRRAVFYNGFADHFLTDGFAAGHVRVPRAEIRAWCEKKGWSDKLAGALSKLLHDQDGHVKSLHGEGENARPDSDGLRVKNAVGQEWYTKCDGQLFLGGKTDSLAVSIPVKAVTESVKELLVAWKDGVLPEEEYAATQYVAFPHPEAPKLIEKFPANMSAARLEELYKSGSWFSKIPWIGPEMTRDSVRALLAELPELMRQFRENVAKSIEGDDELKRRLAPEYVSAFEAIS